MPKTKLSWPDYKKAALKLKSQGLGFPKIYERLGVPAWNGVEYKLESDRGSIKRKSRAASRSGKASSTRTRSTNLAISTPEGTDTRATNRLVKEINAAGGQADHIAELSRTGNAMRDMSPERRQLMQQRMVTGHQESNIQYLTPEDNNQKNRDYRKLDSHLRRLALQDPRVAALGMSKPPQLKTKSKSKPKPKSKPSRTLRLGSVLGSSSGSEIVDRVNEKMHLTAPHLADLGFEFF